MILQIFSNPDWIFIINFVGISLGLISLYKSYKYPFEKIVDLINSKNSTLIPESENNLQSNFKSHKIELLFKNLGLSTTILKKDWAQKITIEFLSKVKTQHVETYTNDKHNQVKVKMKDCQIILDCDFIEPKKYLKVIIYYSSLERVIVNVSGKIIGGNEIKVRIDREEDKWAKYYYGKKIADADFFHFPLITVMFFLVFSYCS